MLSAQRAMTSSPAVRQSLITYKLRRLLTGPALKPQSNTEASALRLALREICANPDLQTEKPEQLLISFKLSLTEAANDVSISPGPERTALLDQVLTIFIEELYVSPRVTSVREGNGRGA